MAGVNVTQSAQVAFSLLSPDVQAKLTSAGDLYQSAAQTAQPLIDIASSVASGQVVTPTQAVAGLSTIATAIGGPIGGAAMAAAGGLVLGVQALLTGLFESLGLYDHPAEYNYVGLRRDTDAVPYGVNDPDWWVLDSVNALNALTSGQVKNPYSGQYYPPLSGFYNVVALSMLMTVLQQLQTAGSDPNWPHTQLSPFERYFLPMLRADLEMWANGSGYVPTRVVLGNAADAWNRSHSSASSDSFQPVDYGSSGYLNNAVPSMVLGGEGDLNQNIVTRAPPLTVNEGVFAPPKTSTTSIAKHAAVVAGGGVAAGLLYAWATGKAIDAVFGGAWKTLSSWGADAVHAIEGRETRRRRR